MSNSGKILDGGVQQGGRPAVCDILAINVAWLDWAEAYRRIVGALGSEGQTVVAFLNANNANIAIRNPAFHQALEDCLVLPDGIGVDIAAKTLCGKPFPANLNGTDFIPALLSFITKPLKVAMLGARPDVLDKATEEFTRKTPWHEFVAVSDGYFDKDHCENVLSQLADINPDIVLIAMGSPVQELWIQENIRPQHGRVVFSVGALFDFVSETVPRAPKLVRTLRCEWIFRLIKEPRRLWRRYILGNPLFLFYVLRYRLISRRSAGESAAA
jgi:exopolysaccharide biosynthesis WecB/TagA/CpsF family protein